MAGDPWQLDVRHDGRDSRLSLTHPSGLCRQWNGDLACRLCQRLGLNTGRYPCPKSSAWRLFLLAHDLDAPAAVEQEDRPLDLDELLRAHGLRPTATRRAIAARLFPGPRHVTVDALADELARAGTRYSQSKVARTLREFADWDLLQVHDLGGGVVFFDTVTAPHAHVYFEDTGELVDLGRDQAWVTGTPALPPGALLAGVQLVFRARRKPGNCVSV